jgi:hypothetical protein
VIGAKLWHVVGSLLLLWHPDAETALGDLLELLDDLAPSSGPGFPELGLGPEVENSVADALKERME